MDAVAAFAVALLKDKIERTNRVLPNGRSVTLNADAINQDLLRIIAQIEAKDRNPSYVSPQLGR